MLNRIQTYGRQPVLEALRSGQQVNKIWLADNLRGTTISKIQKIAADKGIASQTVGKNDIQKVVGAVVHQGVAAEVMFEAGIRLSEFEDLLDSEKKPLFLILDQIQDVHNMGAIMRTAEVCGVDCIVLPEKGSCELNATVAKTSAGAMFHLKIHQTDQLEAIIEMMNDRGIATLAALPRGGTPIFEMNLDVAAALVIGSEGRGVRKNIARHCRQAVYIPQWGKVNSLNASVSTAIILYEIVRQRHCGDGSVR